MRLNFFRPIPAWVFLFTFLQFAASAQPEKPLSASERDVDRVVVVRNDDSPVSCAIANDYVSRRGVANLVAVRCQDSATGADKETISFSAYQKSIEEPLRAFLASHPRVDFIVLTKGVPIRIKDAPGRGAGGKRPSLDSFIAALDYQTIPNAITIDVKDGGFTGIAWANRFWDSHEPFSHARFGGYLVTRLDGYTEADARALTTRALEAEKTPPVGSILLDTCPTFGFADSKHQPASLLKKPAVDGKGMEIGELNYNEYNADMRSAADLLKARSVPVELDLNDKFIGDRTGLMGYISWGSNDRHFDEKAYHQLRFAPGSLCETAVSTSARTFLT